MKFSNRNGGRRGDHGGRVTSVEIGGVRRRCVSYRLNITLSATRRRRSFLPRRFSISRGLSTTFNRRRTPNKRTNPRESRSGGGAFNKAHCYSRVVVRERHRKTRLEGALLLSACPSDTRCKGDKFVVCLYRRGWGRAPTRTIKVVVVVVVSREHPRRVRSITGQRAVVQVWGWGASYAAYQAFYGWIYRHPARWMDL